MNSKRPEKFQTLQVLKFLKTTDIINMKIDVFELR